MKTIKGLCALLALMASTAMAQNDPIDDNVTIFELRIPVSSLPTFPQNFSALELDEQIKILKPSQNTDFNSISASLYDLMLSVPLVNLTIEGTTFQYNGEEIIRFLPETNTTAETNTVADDQVVETSKDENEVVAEINTVADNQLDLNGLFSNTGADEDVAETTSVANNQVDLNGLFSNTGADEDVAETTSVADNQVDLNGLFSNTGADEDVAETTSVADNQVVETSKDENEVVAETTSVADDDDEW